MKKLLSAVFLLSLIVNFTSVTPNVKAITAIPEGAIIKTANNPDVYIVKYKNGKQFKRLVLNPQVFESYGHLRWEDILTVSQNEIDSFITSDLVRTDGLLGTYRLTSNSNDIGSKTLIYGNYDQDSIFMINKIDYKNYVTGEIKGNYTTTNEFVEFYQKELKSKDDKFQLANKYIETLNNVIEIYNEILDVNNEIHKLSDKVEYEMIKNSLETDKITIDIYNYYLAHPEKIDKTIKGYLDSISAINFSERVKKLKELDRLKSESEEQKSELMNEILKEYDELSFD